MSHMIGIDLWTAKSCAVCLLDGTYYVVPKTDAHALDKEKTFTQKLSYCRYAAQEWLEERVQGAVITVPDGFDLLQRQAVLDAGKAAGFGQVRLLGEAAATALVCGRRRIREGKEAFFLACALSGHNLSLCAAEAGDNMVEIVDCAALEFYPALGWTPDMERAVQRMIDFKKPEFALVTGDAAANQDIIAALERLTGESLSPTNPKSSFLAMGAAVMGAVLDWSERDLLLLDALPSGLWLQTGKDTAEMVFDRSTTFPCKTVKAVSRDTQSELCLLQKGRTVRELRWEELVPAGWKEDEAQISFSVEADGQLNVRFEESENKPKPSETPDEPPPAKQGGAKETILALLPVYDNLERAVRQDTKDSAYKKGVEMTMTQLKKVLLQLGVTEIDALGKPFDPNFHNAVTHIEDGSFGKNIVSRVYQAGFMMENKVIRFAAVEVAN